MKTKKNNIKKFLLLALDASFNSISASVFENGTLKSYSFNDEKFGYSKNMIKISEKAVYNAGYTFDDITHIAACCGPGSFTGVRVCLSAAKGFLLSSTSVGIGVNGLDAIRNEIKEKINSIIIIDSRRGSGFIQNYNEKSERIGVIKEVDFTNIYNYIHDYHIKIGTSKELIIAGYIPNVLSINKLKNAQLMKIKNLRINAKIIAKYVCGYISSKENKNNGFYFRDFDPIYVTEPIITKNKKSKA